MCQSESPGYASFSIMLIHIPIYFVSICSTSKSKRAPRCGENERFERSTRHDDCYPTCANPLPEWCPDVEMKNKCRCRPGFFRDSKGKCTKDCSHEPCAGYNEVRKTCGLSKHCQDTCVGYKLDEVDSLCDNQNCTRNVCECRHGYARTPDRERCILVRDCREYTDRSANANEGTPKNVKCGKNEELKRYTSACFPTCAEPISASFFFFL
ncbi:hypothetical protein Y032_0194g1453 [Ancylostoma ceylanicum]|uniref:TIL domain-containing protein n=1 Tax=Ancylostoma ceylanicum TaxID=53326 RepID=A0A016SQ24_9BILA|nr:hypothetical protein Y032_0194g1453 [Ancylostoma ceylanicum]